MTSGFVVPGSARERLIVALDVAREHEALELAAQLDGICVWLKVGLELYCSTGNPLLSKLLQRNFKVFLDLKLHDIPNTVAGAVRSLAQSGAGLLTVHGGGGGAMLEAAQQAAATPSAPQLVAVTVLTSMDAAQLAGVGLPDSAQTQVLRLAHLATGAGIRALVCSAEEVHMLRAGLGPEVLLVVPGIRPAGSERGDQRRVATPADAIARGASMLVVGRPITQAANPGEAANAILAEMAEALSALPAAPAAVAGPIG